MPGSRATVVVPLIVVMAIAACAAPGGDPGQSGSPAASAAGSAAASGGAPAGIELIEFADSQDLGAAARRELELVGQVRDDAGIPALIGPNGSASLAVLDRLEAEYAQELLREIAAAVDAGRVPQAGVDPVLGGVASIDGAVPMRRAPSAAIDVSLFADTGFTTSAFMGLLTGLVQRAAEIQSGTIPRQETHEETSSGLRQQVDLRTTTTVRTGGGRVVVDITMTATDRIFDAASGSFVALYTSTSTGHFDVSACPDVRGVAAGTYAFETKHELNDVATATAARSGASRSAEAPFRLINGDDAKLQRIEATLDLGADAFGPGSPSGPGPTAPFDWNAAQRVQVVMSPGGSTTGSAGAPTTSGTGGERAGGAMFITSAMAQLFIREVGKEAETFWRSGKCVELTPSDDTRKVDANEKIDLTVTSKAKFGGESIEKPIKATFSGVKSLDPAGRPIDAPATFKFTAGPNKDDKGTIDLEQVSNRGIGKRQVVYTVDALRLAVEIRSEMRMAAGTGGYHTKLHLKPLTLTPSDDGTQRGNGTVTWTTTFDPGVPECRPKTYEGSFPVEVIVRRHPTEADTVLLRSTFGAGELTTETLVCSGRSYPFVGSTFLGAWAAMATQEHTIRIDDSKVVDSPVPGGTSKTTIYVRKAAS